MPRLPKFDFYLFLIIILLLGFGIGMVSSVCPDYLYNQLFYVLISLFLFLIFSFIDVNILFLLSPFIYVFNIIFLILPFIFGRVTRGAVRWIPLGSFTIQPSEIVKPFLALVSAIFWEKSAFTFKRLFIFIFLISPIVFLIFLQPDLGSTLVVLSIFLGIILFLGIKFKQFLFLSIAFVLLIPLLWASLKDYQKFRLIHFVNPYSDPLGEGYNLIQAKITVGSGGIFGRGLGRGTQSHLAFLPERHTDFIFASLAEEFGFVGSSFVLLLYLFLILRIFKVAWRQKERLFFFLAIGLFSYLSFQIVVNLGMNVGLLPITGITLPLISYGGSSLLATMISLGILENLSSRGKEEKVIEIK